MSVKQPRCRRLRFEQLEDRELLSINTLSVPAYSSLAESTYTIFLDFNGHDEPTILGQRSGSAKPQAFDLDGNDQSFSATALQYRAILMEKAIRTTRLAMARMSTFCTLASSMEPVGLIGLGPRLTLW